MPWGESTAGTSGSGCQHLECGLAVGNKMLVTRIQLLCQAQAQRRSCSERSCCMRMRHVPSWCHVVLHRQRCSIWLHPCFKAPFQALTSCSSPSLWPLRSSSSSMPCSSAPGSGRPATCQACSLPPRLTCCLEWSEQVAVKAESVDSSPQRTGLAPASPAHQPRRAKRVDQLRLSNASQEEPLGWLGVPNRP